MSTNANPAAPHSFTFAFAVQNFLDRKIAKPYRLVSVPCEFRISEDSDGGYIVFILDETGEEITRAWDRTAKGAEELAEHQAAIKYMTLSEELWQEVA